MQLHSPAFAEGALIPRLHTAEGADLSPPLCWSALPPGTRSLCLILDDPDAPAGLWVPWVLYVISPEAPGLHAGLPWSPRLEYGSCQGRCGGAGGCSSSPGSGIRGPSYRPARRTATA